MSQQSSSTTAQQQQQQQQDKDHAHEVAATLMTVAKGGAPAPASLLQQHAQYTTLFSSIGFGIDQAGNATEACAKAVQDATERGKLNTTPLTASQYQFHIQLGVPGLPALNGVPQNIDTGRLAALLPPNIPKQFQVQCGGLLVPAIMSDGTSAGLFNAQSTCVVVASLTLQQKQSFRDGQPTAVPVAMGSPTSVTNSPIAHGSPNSNATSPTNQAAASQNPYASVATAPSVPHVPTTWEEVEQMQQQQVTFDQEQQQQQQQLFAARASADGKPTRNKSIEMLARISSEMMGQEQAELLQQQLKQQQQELDDADNKKGGINSYKKLPPGTTPKNHKRLFVQHTYRDHSHEVPLPEELDLVGPKAPVRTPNAAFPLKLHEILTQIENDGHDHIVGWLPHGRSFKIYKQKEFVETILPNYFVMTKKSSFLRQVCCDEASIARVRVISSSSASLTSIVCLVSLSIIFINTAQPVRL